jgi:hypothetical protein
MRFKAVAAGDWPRAFSIASKFARLGSQKAAIMRAQSAALSPGFYRGLGRDPAGIIEAGKAAMRARFERSHTADCPKEAHAQHEHPMRHSVP